MTIITTINTVATVATVATAAPEADSLLQWILVLALLGGTALTLKHLFGRKPTHAELATKAEVHDQLNELERDVHHRFDCMEQKISDERKTAREALGKVHARIDKVVENTSEIKGQLAQIVENQGRLLDLSLTASKK